MTRFCPYCGRNMPDDARMCPYCGKTLAMHEGIRQSPYPIEQKKDNTALIIAIVLILVIIIPIAIAATVYVYVSGMIGSSPMGATPEINMQASLYDSSDNNATIIIDLVSGETAYWHSFYFNIYDVTDGESLIQYTDYTISKPNYSPINVGDQIKITGEGNELEVGHTYALSIINYLTYAEIETVTWTQ